MHSIDLSIVEHKIKLCENAKPIECQIPSLQIAIELLKKNAYYTLINWTRPIEMLNQYSKLTSTR